MNNLPKLSTVNYYEWTDLRNWLCEQMNISVTDFRRYQPDPELPYEDLWIVWQSLAGDSIVDGGMITYNLARFISELEDDRWRKCCDLNDTAKFLIPHLIQLGNNQGSSVITVNYEW